MNKKPKIKSPVVPEKAQINFLKNDPLSNERNHMVILFFVAFGLYFNSIFGGYALDDMIVITNNTFTKQGFAGIKDLLFNDSFLGFTGMENQLSGGRYRPLSMVTFAIEYGIFGASPQISHFINVLLYSTLIVLLYRFLNMFVFRGKPVISFLVALLFAVHPVHTEVVANIKSRDELMCMIFLLLSMEYLFKHILIKRNLVHLLLSMVFFFLSLLSKENGLVYIAVIPMILYYFNNVKPGKALLWAVPVIAVIGLYFVLRFNLTGFKMLKNMEVLNAPFLYATKEEAFATKVAMLGKYLFMLIFPYKMSYDYSFDQIRYSNFADAGFILSFLLNAALVIYAFISFKKRSLISFCILFYFVNMSLVTNFVFEVGTSFADRFLFQPSLALTMIIGYFIGNYLYTSKESELHSRKKVAIAITAGIFLLGGIRTVTRNSDWQTEAKLFMQDVKTCPKSAKTNNNCGVALINLSTAEANETRKKQLLTEAVEKINRSVTIHPKYVDAWLNLGVAYSRLDDLDNTEAAWLKAKALSPNHPKLKESLPILGDFFALKGFKYNQAKDYQNAVKCYSKSVLYKTEKLDEVWYNLGGNYLMLGDIEKAKELWKKTLEINPNNADAKKWLNEISKPR